MGATGKIDEALGRIDGSAAAKGDEDRRLEIDSRSHRPGDTAEIRVRHNIIKNLHLIRRGNLTGQQVDGPGLGQKAIAQDKDPFRPIDAESGQCLLSGDDFRRNLTNIHEPSLP